jgi:hypothetical protein
LPLATKLPPTAAATGNVTKEVRLFKTGPRRHGSRAAPPSLRTSTKCTKAAKTLSQLDYTFASLEVLKDARPTCRQSGEQYAIGDIAGPYPDDLQSRKPRLLRRHKVLVLRDKDAALLDSIFAYGLISGVAKPGLFDMCCINSGRA